MWFTLTKFKNKNLLSKRFQKRIILIHKDRNKCGRIEFTLIRTMHEEMEVASSEKEIGKL